MQVTHDREERPGKHITPEEGHGLQSPAQDTEDCEMAEPLTGTRRVESGPTASSFFPDRG